MINKCDNCITQWDDIFSQVKTNIPITKSSGNKTLDKGITWISDKTETVLDFGCGHGTLLFLCALNGTKKQIGMP